ncbi:hypothetical protein [Bosea sp. PAMC 26642]|uniref:hypothetical protein n=1 Tax=Bosea sp. (strain PAMC 26642) TaxID=1792307 RepID=UPI0007706BBA|nr:hypothetical protein [Bosea sp. PAMC 26642]AMJ59414.1 hypothetical protein AXW83_03035 [Bosea sp. PAMC 26642]
MQNHSKNLLPELVPYTESDGTRLAIIKHLDVTRTPAMKLLNTNVSEWDARKLRLAAIVSSVITLGWWIGLTLVAERPIWFW